MSREINMKCIIVYIRNTSNFIFFKACDVWNMRSLKKKEKEKGREYYHECIPIPKKI